MADKKYRIEGDTLIINDGVTEINTEDFHKHNKDKYGHEILKLKDEIANIKSIIIPDSVTSIGTRAFRDCTSLTSITIPDSVTEIGKDVFKACDNLTIKCNKGSYVEQFAKENHIPVKHIKDKTKTIEKE